MLTSAKLTYLQERVRGNGRDLFGHFKEPKIRVDMDFIAITEG
jgi:hypothetical protein